MFLHPFSGQSSASPACWSRLTIGVDHHDFSFCFMSCTFWFARQCPQATHTFTALIRAGNARLFDHILFAAHNVCVCAVSSHCLYHLRGNPFSVCIFFFFFFMLNQHWLSSTLDWNHLFGFLFLCFCFVLSRMVCNAHTHYTRLDMTSTAIVLFLLCWQADCGPLNIRSSVWRRSSNDTSRKSIQQ